MDLDDSDKTLKNRVRLALVDNYNYIGVVGQDEIDNGYLTLSEKHPTKKDATHELV